MQSYQSTSTVPTTTTTTTQITPLIWFDKDYINSNEGLLKIVVVILSLASFIVAQFAPNSNKGFYCFTSMSAFWISLTLFGLYAFHVVEKHYALSWLLAEFTYSMIWAIFFFVASLLMLIGGGVQTIAAIFGFFACAILGYEAKRNYIRYQNGEIAQGERTSPQTMT